MDRIEEAMGQLGAAIVQSLPSDDQIIMDHVRRAHELVREEWRERQEIREANADVAAAVRLQRDLNRMLGKVFGI